MNGQVRGSLVLLLTAAVWGSSFVAQRAGMEYVGPFTFNGLRCFLGVAVLLPVLWILKAARVRRGEPPSDKRALWKGGAACGAVLFCASSLQQLGIVTTGAGKAGFLTALYILLVPVFGLFLGKRVRAVLWLCVGLGVAGLYLLCATDGWGSIGRGDWLLMGCAACYAVHILIVDRYAPRTNNVALSAVQFLVCGLISLPVLFVLEEPTWASLWACRVPFLYSGVMACGVGYTLQIVGQRGTDPTVASLVMCFEAVFAVMFGWLVLGETATARELAGCGVLFSATVLATAAAAGGGKKETAGA